MTKLGNIFYFIPILILILITLFLVFLTKNKSNKFNNKLIFFILLINAILHFLKIFLPTKDYLFDFPYSFARISLENICAVSVVLFPILYLFKNKYCNDAIIVIGIISAIAAYLAPSQLFVRDLSNPADFIEVFRYYLCHAPLLICPILMLTNKIHRLSYRRVMVVGLFFLANITIVFINGLLLKTSGIVNCSWAEFFSRNYNNPSMVFGPSNQLLSGPFSFIDYLVPSCFKYITTTGDIGYIPVIWLIFPLLIICLIGLIILMIILHKDVKKDYYYLVAKIRLYKLSHDK